ncbi:GGDEF domain-containing response regulator [Agaribacter flavus]|uniref:diguanylate cyclase n=1 Tax=Agaribacter flavus TaxID=1902781 RepID=A0ABV7FQL3_9ALTE
MDIPQEAVVKPRILIVDDEAAHIMTILSIVGKEYEVSFAMNANDAFRLSQQYPQPDLILMDITMPECDGYQLCAMLKADQQTQHIPIIFVSANESEEDIAKGFNVGCVDYLVKPVRQQELKVRVATRLALHKHTRSLEQLAYQDPLTQVANRRKFTETLQREWSRCVRYHQPIAVLIVDLDNFKQINDSFGHAAGDHCLENVAEVLRSSIHRPGDLVARMGGDEFALIFSDFEPSASNKKCRTIQDMIARIPKFKNSDESADLTVSMGMSVMYPDTKSDALDALREADSALYKSKQGGKNCYHISKPYCAGETKLAHFK